MGLGRQWFHRGRRMWRLAVVGLVGTLAATGCATAAARATHPSPTTTQATPSTAVIDDDWSRSVADALDLGGGSTSTLSAVIAPQESGEDWLIAGTRLAPDGVTTATVWSSRDGLRWTSSALAGGDGRALAASAWGTRTVVVGSVGEGNAERAAVWITPGPGQAFSLVPPDAAMLPPTAPAPSSRSTGSGTGNAVASVTGTASMDVVAAGTQGVFAAGSVAGRQAVWYSTDGTDWVRLAGAERLIDATPGAEVTSMLVTPNAVLTAGTVPDGTQTDGAIWTSADGIKWGRYGAVDNPFAGGGDHRIDGLAVDSAGSLIAVGAVRDGPSWIPASWISPNGGTWSQPSEALPTATRPQAAQGGTVVRAVASPGTAPGLVAVGGSSTAQRLWTSTDGQNWAETTLPAGAARASDWSADLVATTGSTTVVVDRGPGQPRVLVRDGGAWVEASARSSIFGAAAPVATPAALVPDGDRLLLAVDVDRPGAVIGQSTSSVDVLATSDGTHWRRLSDGALPGGQVDSMTLVSGSLVAVGSSTTPTGRSAATVWTSATGRVWTLDATFDATPPASEAATTVSALGPTLFAAGTGLGAGSAAAVDATPAASAWSSAGATWMPAGALDNTPSVGADQPLGSCSDGRTLVVVGEGTRAEMPVRTGPVRSPLGTTTTTVATTGSPVGADGQAADGTVARTWASTGSSWTAGTVSPLSGTGAGEAMDGCAAVDDGFIAWGQAPGPQGRPSPALWSSTDGVTWTLEKVATLTVAGAAPLTDLVTSGEDWTAVSGGQLAATADPGDPTATVADPVLPAVAPAAASGTDGSAGVWSSSNGGTTWARAATNGPAWATAGPLSTDLVGVLGDTVVVVGQVDGRVAAWVGHTVAGSDPTAAGVSASGPTRVG